VINLPINLSEYDKILEYLPKDSNIFKKLWSYKVNYLIKEKNNGLS
jgi:hypothetical protein